MTTAYDWTGKESTSKQKLRKGTSWELKLELKQKYKKHLWRKPSGVTKLKETELKTQTTTLTTPSKSSRFRRNLSGLDRMTFCWFPFPVILALFSFPKYGSNRNPGRTNQGHPERHAYFRVCPFNPLLEFTYSLIA